MVGHYGDDIVEFLARYRYQKWNVELVHYSERFPVDRSNVL